MNGSVVLASGVEASCVGSARVPARRGRGWCRGRHGAGVERGIRLGSTVELQDRGASKVDDQRHARPVVTLDRAQAPRQVLPLLVGQRRRRAGIHRRRVDRHPRLEGRRQQNAGLRVGLFVVDGVGDRFPGDSGSARQNSSTASARPRSTTAARSSPRRASSGLPAARGKARGTPPEARFLACRNDGDYAGTELVEPWSLDLEWGVGIKRLISLRAKCDDGTVWRSRRGNPTRSGEPIRTTRIHRGTRRVEGQP